VSSKCGHPVSKSGALFFFMLIFKCLSFAFFASVMGFGRHGFELSFLLIYCRFEGSLCARMETILNFLKLYMC